MPLKSTLTAATKMTMRDFKPANVILATYHVEEGGKNQIPFIGFRLRKMKGRS
jgi:hypothetical protein